MTSKFPREVFVHFITHVTLYRREPRDSSENHYIKRQKNVAVERVICPALISLGGAKSWRSGGFVFVKTFTFWWRTRPPWKEDERAGIRPADRRATAYLRRVHCVRFLLPATLTNAALVIQIDYKANRCLLSLKRSVRLIGRVLFFEPRQWIVSRACQVPLPHLSLSVRHRLFY